LFSLSLHHYIVAGIGGGAKAQIRASSMGTVLALGNQDDETGKVKPVADVVARLRAKQKT
jgi:hypothetical protein